ncbi:hypothetical protein NLU13_2702 [Sarocladium strictum]|uniref:Uncharacterized protein n=1 Tax=Sarocladium strictum TaxID=5046 RepID=A0AA39GNB2_SARSR|nr:hypothetical protein NLU13_2702 [Sarocladium strictum]
MPSKKDRKNAKDGGGGIAAAVTKQTAGKFSNDSSSSLNNKSGHGSDTSSPAVDTPEFRPTVSPSYANSKVSPMLHALPVPEATMNGMTNDWAKNGFGGSPGNLISLMGESPPTMPSSYEDSGRVPHPWQSTRPFMTPAPASPSPPNSIRRPLSYQMEPRYQSPEPSAYTPGAANRRSSLQSQFTQARHPPLPHQPQAHYYGAPNIDLSASPQSGMKAGERGYFFGFDKLPNESGGADNVIIAGYEGGLEVHSVSKKGLEPVARLKGLRGGVRHAKILPWKVTGEAAFQHPLVAVVLHGPVLRSDAPEVTIQDTNGSPQPGGTASPRSVFSQAEGMLGRPASVEFYQTAVHVYSLKTQKLVDVLLECQRIPISAAISVTSPLFQPPPPSGAFSIKADAGTVAVCSGLTGECWIYLQLLEKQNTHAFACVGKLWTSVQHGGQTEVAEELEGTRPAPPSSTPSPVFAVKGRWIAYCPMSPTSQTTLRAHVPLPILGKAPGVSSQAPPNLPPSTAAVDLPISDSLVNKLMRETTQELIQGARWVGQQGLQAWNSYWSKSPSAQSPPQQARSPPQNWVAGRSPQRDPVQFPPTHGSPGHASQKDPGLVSILDAESMVNSSLIHPLTTFTAPLGCSFLSFSPSGLSLFTASSKGDVQTVWDLLRLQVTRSSPLQSSISTSDISGPLVRQIAQFSRMTVARIVEVAWAGPHGERIAMVTERGTVHLLDMPFSAFMWPPPRRRKFAQDNAGEASEPSSSAVSIASGALGAAYSAAKPFVTRSRRSSAAYPSSANSTTFKDSAAQGGRVIAASISSSLGKTGTAISQLRQTGENRVSLPPSSHPPETACITWIKTRKAQVLFSIGSGLVRTFPCKTRQATVRTGKRIAKPNRYKDLTVPLLPDDAIAPAVRQLIDSGVQEEYLDLSEREMEAGNTITLEAPHMPKIPGPAAAIPQAEIESSAPYQPFHTDRRVSLCEYTVDAPSQLDAATALLAETSLDDKPVSKKKKKGQPQETHVTHIPVQDSVWAFGQPIASIKLDLGPSSAFGEDSIGPDDHRALPASAMERVMQYGDQEQIVVTTRRRRGARQGEQDEDGFFEDDCEVLDFADQRV